MGVPSGQIIDIDSNSSIRYLIQGGYLFYNTKYSVYVFDDDDYDKIFTTIRKKFSGPEIETGEKKRLIELQKIMDFFKDQKHVKEYKINPGGTIDIVGSIFCSMVKYKQIPFRFGVVKGDFIFRNSALVTLENSPRRIEGSFDCSYNNLIDLYNGPIYVGKNYNCSNNLIISLNGSPSMIHGDMDCSNNKLTDLNSKPHIIDGYFDYSGNPVFEKKYRK
jgi:hypothetical protein